MKTIFKTLVLVVCFFMTASLSALAGGGGTTWYFSKVTAKATPTGSGLVYVSKSKTTPASNKFSESSEEITDSESQDHPYYLFVSPSEGRKFDGWFTDPGCSQRAQTTRDGNAYVYNVHAESTNSNARDEFNLYAKFSEIVNLYNSRLTVHSVGAPDCLVNVAGGKFGTEVTASILNSPDTEHSYVVSVSDNNPGNCTFEGWYSDVACTKLVSTSMTYTYLVRTSSVDADAPTHYHLYAKFKAQDLFQLRNSSFEEWETVNGSGEEPLYWSSFATATGSMAGSVKNNDQLKKEAAESYDGNYCARISARNVIFGIIAQGNMTTGCINGGSMTATDANGNYNYTNEGDAGQAMRFGGRPDAMKVWVKSSCAGTVKIAAYLHEKGYFQDPVEGNKDRQVAMVGSATLTPESNNLTWTEYTVPFEYTSNKNPYYALVSFATNSTPGKGNASDVMYVDKVTMVYNSELTSATFDGAKVTFNNGAASVKGGYDPKVLKLTSNGAGAIIATDYDDATRVLTITVKGQDYTFNPTNVHVYTIQFSEAAVDIEEPDVPEGPIFAINFDEDATPTRNDRQVTYISLTTEDGNMQTFSIEPGKVYTDLTNEAVFVVEENTEVSGEIGYNGDWMHGYFYIDLDHDYQLSCNAYDQDQSGTELLSYSFWSGDLYSDTQGYNSLGELFTDNARNTVIDKNRIALPVFTAPGAGEYKVRFKVDWNSVEPGGNTNPEQDFLTNGGFIVDAILRVKPDPAGIHQILVERALPTFDLQGRRVYPELQSKGVMNAKHGLYIQNGKKVIR